MSKELILSMRELLKQHTKQTQPLSTLSFRELDVFCRGFAYINSVESERPDNWECKTIFENTSSFTVDLVKLQVSMKGSDTTGYYRCV